MPGFPFSDRDPAPARVVQAGQTTRFAKRARDLARIPSYLQQISVGRKRFRRTGGGDSHNVIALIGSLLAITTLALVVMALVAVFARTPSTPTPEEDTNDYQDGHLLHPDRPGLNGQYEDAA
ncbi:hypothetical protein GCM10009872_57790 [Actinopolymorpha rutila]